MDVEAMINQINYKKEVLLKNLQDLGTVLMQHNLNISMSPVVKALDSSLECLKFFEFLEQVDNNKTYLLQQGSFYLVLHIDSNNFITYYFNENNKDFQSFSTYADIPISLRQLAKDLLNKVKLNFTLVLDMEQDRVSPQILKQSMVSYDPTPVAYKAPQPIYHAPQPSQGYDPDFKLPVDARTPLGGLEEEDTSLQDLMALQRMSGGISHNKDYTQPTNSGSVTTTIQGKQVDLNKDYTS